MLHPILALSTLAGVVALPTSPAAAPDPVPTGCRSPIPPSKDVRGILQDIERLLGPDRKLEPAYWTEAWSSSRSLMLGLLIESSFSGEFRRLSEPIIEARHLPLLVETLGLDEQQSTEIGRLIEDHQRRMRDLDRSTRDRLRTAFASMESSLGSLPRSEIDEGEARIREELRSIMDVSGAAADNGPSISRESQALIQKHMTEVVRAMSVDTLRSTMHRGLLGPEDARSLVATIEELTTTRSRLRAEFESRILGCLTETQARRWPDCFREITRERLLPRGNLSGESVDILRIVQDLRPATGAPDIAPLPILDDYADQLHRALRERERSRESSLPKLLEAMADRDVQDVRRIIRSRMESRRRVRDLNLQFAKAVESVLEDSDDRIRISESILIAAFPGIRGDHQGTPDFGTALSIDELAPEVRQLVIDLRERYRDARSRWELDVVSQVSQFEPRSVASMELVAVAAVFGGLTPESLTDLAGERERWYADAVAARRRLTDRLHHMNRTFRSQLRTLLGPELTQQVPEPADDADDPVRVVFESLSLSMDLLTEALGW